uniref:Uncharacterized protein LOC104228781 isoform X1 n=1 Tax=Nicotiana sylvestris TaxID=4096 RepID=A0A1U7WZH9_NICSY|nr:PREDICTED: uncharacterized protein LOC104228781 isoform X1 [Nicotiana sylvestris]
MSSIGTSKGVLEIAKFAVYVSVPISLMYLFANNNKNLQKIMGHMNILERRGVKNTEFRDGKSGAGDREREGYLREGERAQQR